MQRRLFSVITLVLFTVSFFLYRPAFGGSEDSQPVLITGASFQSDSASYQYEAQPIDPTSHTPLFTALFPKNFGQGISVTSSRSGSFLTLVPEFLVNAPGRTDAKGILYDLSPDVSALYEFKQNRIKESIVYQKISDTNPRLSFRLEMSSSLFARKDASGNILIYKTTNTPAGTRLQENQTGFDTPGVFEDVVFVIPAPVIFDAKGATYKDRATFEFSGNRLTVVSDLNGLNAPVTIDPSIVITTSPEFKPGNDEGGMIAFDTDQVDRSIVSGGALDTAFTSTSTAASYVARKSHGAVIANGYMYLVGGLNSSGTPITDVRRAKVNADGSVDPFTSTNSLITARYEHTVVAYNGYIYAIGGYGSSGALSSIEYAKVNLDGSLGLWSSDPTGLPLTRAQHTSVVYNGYLYVIGGIRSVPVNDVIYCPLKADGKIGSWTTSSNTFGTARYNHASVVHNGFLYVIGGANASDVELGDVQYSAIKQDGSIANFSSTSTINARSGHAAVAHQGWLYVVGGIDGSNTKLNDIQYARFNASGDLEAFASTQSFTNGRTDFVSLAFGNYFYVSGGDAFNGSNITADDVLKAHVANSGALFFGVPSWTTNALGYGAVGSGAREQFGFAAYNNFIYITGGGTGAPIFNDVLRANINSGGNLVNWTNIGSFANGRVNHTSHAYNGNLYIIGGRSVPGVTGEVYRSPIDSSGNLTGWTPTTSLPATVENHASVIYKNRLYVIGGLVNGVNSTNVYYNTINQDGTLGPTWTLDAGTSFTTARSSHEAFVYNGNLYVLGGDNGTATPLSDVQFAPINADGSIGTWQTTTPLPAPRAVFTAIAYEGYAYIMGGYDGAGGTNTLHYSAIASNGTLSSWTAGSSFTGARYKHSSEVYRGVVYLSGGYSTAHQSDIQYFKIRRPPARGIYSTLFDTGTDNVVTGVSITETAGTKGSNNMSYASATASSTPFGNVTSVPDILGGTTYSTGLNVCARYLWLRFDLDDSLQAVADGASSRKDVLSATVNYTLAAPTITSITQDPCTNGIQVNFTANGSTTHSLWKDGVQVVGSYTSGATYNPGDSASHSYVVRATNHPTCPNADSAPMSISDTNIAPAAASTPTFSDTNTCATNGFSINWTGDAGATFQLIKDGNVQPSNITSPFNYFDNSTTVYSFKIRTNKNGCSVDSSAASKGDTNDTPSTPGFAFGSPSDISTCASSGLNVSYTGDPTATHDLLRKDTFSPFTETVVVTNVVSGSTYQPGNNLVYDYRIRSTKSGCTSFSSSNSRADTNNSPSIFAFNAADFQACSQTGVRITFSTNATNHYLYKDGQSAIGPISSGYVYDPGDILPHDYVIRAEGSTGCLVDSTPVTASDSGIPAPTSNVTATDISSCSNGVQISFSNSGNAASYDLNVDGGAVEATGITNPYTYSPGNSSNHSYAVVAVRDGCSNAGTSTNETDVNNTPPAQSFTLTDVSSCTSAIQINFTNDGTSQFDLVRSDTNTVVAANVVNGSTFNAPDTLSHPYVLRRTKNGCPIDSAPQSIADVSNAPGIAGSITYTDVSGCANNLQVTFTNGSGATSYNLVRDGNVVVTGITSGATYTPPDNNSHNYVLRSVNALCTNDSGAQNITDVNNTPAAINITAATDVDSCTNGITVSYTGPQGDLWKDGVLAASNYASGTTYTPGNASSHSYQIRKTVSSCTTTSNSLSASDINNTPGTAVITSVSDPDSCLTGLNFSFTPGAGALTHSLLRNGVSVVTDFQSPYSYVPPDGNSAAYTIQENGPTSCISTSGSASGTDTRAAAMTVTKTGPSTAYVGDAVNYSIQVTNPSGTCTQSAVMTDNLPPELTLVSATPTQGSCTGNPNISCSLGNLNPGASATVAVNTTANAPGSITNTATVGAASSNKGTVITASANISITKTATPDPLLPGQTLTYTMTVTNNGPSAATSVVVNDTLPSQVFLQTRFKDDENTALEFAGGTYTDTQWNATLNAIELVSPATTGTFDSAIKDAGQTVNWGSLGWLPEMPANKELVNSKGVETGYPDGNIDMAASRLLIHLNEASGNISDNASGLSGIPSFVGYSQPGKLKTAVNYNGCFGSGCGTRITVLNSGPLNTNGPTTIMGWYRPSDNSKRFLLEYQDSGFQGIELTREANGALSTNFRSTTAQSHTLTSNANLLLQNNWYHVAATYDGTTLALYINGSQVKSSTPGSFIPETRARANVGWSFNNSGQYWAGDMDEVTILARALSASEIAAAYKRGSTSIRIQVRSCDDPACAGESFVGPDGTAATYYSEINNTKTTPPLFALSNVVPNRYFQYRVLLDTDNAAVTPRLKSVYTLDLGPSQGSCNIGPPLSCSLGTIPNGASATVTVGVVPNATGDITNTATATASSYDPVTPNSASVTTSLSPAQDYDGDGIANSGDCQPGDANVWGIPTESRDLIVAGNALNWIGPLTPGGNPGTWSYDVLRSPSPSNFMTGTTCVQIGGAALNATDSSNPTTTYYYLIRIKNVCGSNLGTNSSGTPRTGRTCP